MAALWGSAEGEQCQTGKLSFPTSSMQDAISLFMSLLLTETDIL